MPKKITTIIVGLILVGATSLIIEDNNYFSHKPQTQKHEQDKGNKASKANPDRSNMIRELQSLQVEYAKATTEEDEKETLGFLILHHASSFDLNQPDTPVELRRFIENLRVARSNKLADSRG